MTPPRLLCAALCAAILIPLAQADAQSLSDRIEHVKKQRARAGSSADDDHARRTAQAERLMRARLAKLVGPIELTRVPAEDAVRYWARLTNVNIIVNWDGLESVGVDIEAPITIRLDNKIPADQLLSIIMLQISEEPRLMTEVTPWYVRMVTRDQANANAFVKTYDISDLLVRVPDFSDPPNISLSSATGARGGGSSGGGGGGGGGSSLFPDSGSSLDENHEEEKAQEIIDLIRETIEPDIWQENGGEYGSIKYFRRQLIIKAPAYVHEQIGGPVGSTARSATSRRSPAPTRHIASAEWKKRVNKTPNGVSAVRDTPDAPVSGINNESLENGD